MSKEPTECWSAIKNLAETSKNYQKCIIERLTLSEMYFECENSITTGVKTFASKFYAGQKVYSKKYDTKLSFHRFLFITILHV